MSKCLMFAPIHESPVGCTSALLTLDYGSSGDKGGSHILRLFTPNLLFSANLT
eukprot:SAG11_NODE_1205_length_5529_cov_6.569797_2_plen_53_part_00